jgi:Lon protease-like protein
MKAGNVDYTNAGDIPSTVPVFPLSGALLLPGGQMPLNIFEPRYLAMIDDAIGSNRLIGMVQPLRACVKTALPKGAIPSSFGSAGQPELCDIGCLGRITAFQESGDGRYMINLSGVCRYRITREVEGRSGYRRCEIACMPIDLEHADDGSDVDREQLLETFRRYLKANDLEADWESICKASNETLVTALCMMSPYGPAEKQALLEADNMRIRADTLIAITEIALARGSGDDGPGIQ